MGLIMRRLYTGMPAACPETAAVTKSHRERRLAVAESPGMRISHPIARTAFYCCVIRADDAARSQPLCGDSVASCFIDDEIRRDLAPLLRFRAPAVSNVGRHRIIDDIVRGRLTSNPQQRVILVGAGFDTRAYRMNGGRWFEFDEPQLIAFKEERLPATDAPNPLQRVPVAFATVAPDAFLAPLAGDDDALVILEGVSMYLSDDALTALALALGRHLPGATLVSDLMSPMFARTFSRALQQALRDMGAVFGTRNGHPRAAIERGGWRAVGHVSIPGRTAQLGALPIPGWVLATFLRGLRDGYQIFTFETNRA